jgi:hypothetical protein
MIKKYKFEATHLDDKEVKGWVQEPSQKILSGADLVYKTRFSEALRLGALTNSEAIKFMTEREIWTDKDTTDLIDIYRKISELGIELLEIDNLDDGAQVVLQIESLRYDALRLNQKKSSVLDNTADAYAEEHRLQFFTINCTYADGGRLAWSDTDEFLQSSSTDFAKMAISKTLHMLANQGEDFRKEWPEYQWRVKMGLMDENLKPIEVKTEEVTVPDDSEDKLPPVVEE